MLQFFSFQEILFRMMYAVSSANSAHSRNKKNLWKPTKFGLLKQTQL